MESVYDLTDSLYRQGWEHAESVDDYFYGPRGAGGRLQSRNAG